MVESIDLTSSVNLYQDIQQGEDTVVIWNGREIRPLRGRYSPSNPEVILCSKDKNHGRGVFGLLMIVAGAAISCLPGGAAIGGPIAIAGVAIAGPEIAEAEVDRKKEEEKRKRDEINRQIQDDRFI
ncbi:MAG: hypothetical protein AAF443_04455 [Chlamydiota bacterium]